MQVKALSNIRHDQVDYVKDDVIDVSEKEGRQLVEAGVAVVESGNVSEGDVKSDTQPHSDTRFKVDDDVFDVRITKDGKTQYVKNGKLTSQSKYKAAKEQAIETPTEEQPQLT